MVDHFIGKEPVSELGGLTFNEYVGLVAHSLVAKEPSPPLVEPIVAKAVKTIKTKRPDAELDELSILGAINSAILFADIHQAQRRSLAQ